MLGTIVNALDAQHKGDGAIRPTVLTVRFVETGVPNRLAIEVTNTGDAAAYQVRARLQSGFSPLHGLEVVFGRIGPKQSKTWNKVVPVQAASEGASPMVVAEINASNARPINASARFRLHGPVEHDPERLDALKIDCQALEPRVAPGSRARVRCKLKNQGKAPLKSLTYEIGIRPGKPMAGSGPAEIPAGSQSETELIVPIPADARAGQKLVVIAAVRNMRGVVTSPPVEISAAQGVCPGKLTQAEYLAKRKKLEGMFSQGALTQAELDKYDAELVSCLR